MHAALVIHREPQTTRIRVAGAIDRTIAPAFAVAVARDVKLLAAHDDTIVLDLDDLELRDGHAVAEAINVLRELSAQAPLEVQNAPQMLAHSLYKTGMLRSGRIRLESPKEDTGRSS